MNQLICWLIFASLAAANPKLFQIQQRFDASQEKLASLTLPPIEQQRSLQDELKLFGQMHQQNDFTYFKANPEMGAQLLLKKENRWRQSLYFMGREVSNLLLEITIIHEKGIHKFDNQSIKFYLINCQTGEVLFAQRVKHLRLFKTEVTSELYELRAYFESKEPKQEEEQASKHIRVNMEIVGIGAKQRNSTDEDASKTFEKMTFINDETSRIFMNSLQIWEEVQKHHQQHFQNQEKVYFQVYIELIAVMVINLIELLLLKRMLKVRTIL